MTNLIAAALLLSSNPGLAEAVDLAAADTAFAGRIVVTQGGEVVLEKSYGSANVEFHVPVHHNTRFKIFSTSKQITAMAAFLLAEEGRLDLKSPAGDFFESWPEQWKEVRVIDLIHHTSGIPDLVNDWAGAWRMDERAAMNEFLAAQTAKPLSDPGAEWRYSNFGYCLLANVIEAAAGQEFDSFVEESIFRPAGMKDAIFESPAVNAAGETIGWQTVRHLATPYHGSPDSLTVRGGISYVMKGAGGVICTVDDMARYGEAVLSGRFLPIERTKVMWTDTTPTGGSPYGYGWVVRTINGQTVPSHSGGNNGYISELSIVPEKGIVVAVASNRAYASARAMSDAALKELIP